MRIKHFNEFDMEIPSEIKELSDIFKKNGKKLYIVGGYCRDILMGKDPLDIDLATDSLPDESIRFLSTKYHIDNVGKAFGVIIVHLGKMKIEIASFRKDLEDSSGGRHPEIKLGVSIEDDVLRRDLTISSLFYDIEEGKIVDLVGGRNDIKNKIIRMVGDPKIRLQEDQLRSLRAIRFATRYGFSIDIKTKDALKNSDLSKISKERIWDEIDKGWNQSQNFTDYLNYITEFNMWGEVFPGANINTDFVKSSNFVVVIASLFKKESPIRLRDKLVSYKIPDSPESGHISSKIAFLIQLSSLIPETVTDVYGKKRQCGIDDDTILEWLKVNNIKEPIFNKFIGYRPSVSSQDLMKQGLKGKPLGDEIRRLEIEKFKQL